jgi:hypothetical protein
MRRLLVLLAVFGMIACSDPADPKDDLGGMDNVGDQGDVQDVDDVNGEDVDFDDGAPDLDHDADVSDADAEPTEDVTPDEDVTIDEDVTTDEGVINQEPDFEALEREHPVDGKLPRELPFAFVRPPVGEPIDQAEITEFTKTIAAAYKEIGFFRWLLRTSIGVDHSTGKDDFLAWYNGATAVKEAGTITIEQRDGEHNMWIPGGVVLTSVLNGYLHTGDWEMARLTEQYCKGLTAVVKGFVWGTDDPAPYLMARAIFPMDQEFVLDADFWKDDGRRKNVKFTTAYRDEDHWNAQTFAWPENPTWGSIWVTNMRSKDDVRSISRTSVFLPYLIEDANDDWVREACQETWDTMVGFHKDIVDSNYSIRTKDSNGVAYTLPCDDQKDLGSYNCFSVLDEKSECCARLSADMLAYGHRKTNDCGTCTGSLFDAFASAAHYYNIPIIWDYHMAGLGSSLLKKQYRDAWFTLVGLAERIDSYMFPDEYEPGPKDARWNRDMAQLLVQAASMGLPLTDHEARHIQKYWLQTAQYLKTWTNWDLWDESVPDGEYRLRPPNNNDAVEVEAFAVIFEYCSSPFKNPAGAAFVDCDVLADVANW